MQNDKKLILGTIAIRKKANDKLRAFETRNKASPEDYFEKFKPENKEAFENIFSGNIDGLKLRFRYATLFINGRY